MANMYTDKLYVIKVSLAFHCHHHTTYKFLSSFIFLNKSAKVNSYSKLTYFALSNILPYHQHTTLLFVVLFHLLYLFIYLSLLPLKSNSCVSCCAATRCQPVGVAAAAWERRDARCWMPGLCSGCHAAPVGVT